MNLNMRIFQTATFSKTNCSACRIARATLRTIAPIKPIHRQFPYTAFLRGASVVTLILMFSGYRASGIEGLRISIQNGTNVVLGWPSATNETHLIQYCGSLSSPASWQVLTDYYPSFGGTNWTTYMTTNTIPISDSGGGSGGGAGGSGPPSPDDATIADGATVASSEAISEDD